MNPLTDALKLAEDPRPAPAAVGSDASPGLATSVEWPFGPLRATRDDVGPDDVATATAAPGALRGSAVFGEWPSGSLRASSDDADPDAPARAVPDGHEPSDPATSAERWLEPIRATRDDVGPQAAAAPDRNPAGRDARAPVRSPGSAEHHGSAEGDSGDREDVASGPDAYRGSAEGDSGDREDVASGPDAPGAPFDGSAPEPFPVAGESRAAGQRAFDARALPRRPGIGRVVGSMCTLVAACASAGTGGYILWSTEFARPALVRRLPSVPVPVMDSTPVRLANAATIGDGTSVAGTALVTGPRSAPPAPGAAKAPPAPVRNDEPPESASSAPSSASMGRARPGEGRVGLAQSAPAVETMEHSVAGVSSGAFVRPGPASASEPAVDRSGPALETTVARPGPAPEYAVNRPGPAPEQVGNHPVSVSEPTFERPVPASESSGAAGRPDSAAGIVIRKRIRADHVAASLERGREALLAGDGESAAQMYRAVLGHEPGNRDARLGLAAVAARAGRWNEAAAHYARILASRPGDTVALAALIAIDARDPAPAENRLKALLRGEPRAAHLHFALGSLYAAQSRWPEAQQSWFDAHRFDRGNADYAYNLAVSLDHLAQARSALGLYREALVLSRRRPASFDDAAVRRRIRDLDPLPEAGFTTDRPPPEAGSTTDRSPPEADSTTDRRPPEAGFTTDRPPPEAGFTTDGPPPEARLTTDRPPPEAALRTDRTPPEAGSTTDRSPPEAGSTTDRPPPEARSATARPLPEAAAATPAERIR